MSAFVRFSINSLLISKHFTTKLNRFRKPEICLLAVRSKYSTQSAPNYGTVEKDESNKTNETNQISDEWTMIYRYKYITVARAFCRLKLYQTAFLTATTPLTIYAYSMDNVSLQNCQFFIGLNIFSCLTLYIFGNLFRRVVGIVYINEMATKTKIAHLTFWGNRMDNVHNIDDLVPLLDLNNANDLFCKIRLTSDDKVLYYISLKHGIVVVPDKFYNVFGTYGSF